jgi:alkyldihydroxyacetonephosphate synthase
MTPVPPIALEGVVDSPRPHIGARRVQVSDATLGRLRDACATVVTDVTEVAEASRDWWPVAMQWALDGEVPGLASVVVRPESVAEVAAILAVCNADRVPVTAAAGRSGVCGASVPVHGGVVLDLCGLAGIVDVDNDSLVLDVLPGTFGEPLEEELRAAHGVTLGHWPQSVAISTVGGWLACRGAGQLSTRYGKIEDMVVGLDVALADGRTLSTGGAPRAAAGPDFTQLFVGSEGTLGVITGARLRVHPAPGGERRDAWSFGSFEDGLDACRRILRRGATPAVLRLYDDVEANRSYQTGDRHVLLVYDEGDAAIIDGVMRVVAEECDALNGERADVGLVDRWFHHRNEVTALEALTRKGFVVDTMEIAARWRDLPKIYDAARAAIMSVPGAAAATAHQSHAYTDGACLYFTFAGRPPAEQREAFYVAAWDAGTRAVLANGGALSHHHGVGLNRSRFVREALGGAFEVLQAAKSALDPNGVLNPGKLGLPSPFGEVPWPVGAS